MEGLIRGLVNVTLDALQGNDETESTPRDDRDRSTWSQVVSGEQESHDGRSNSRTNYNTKPMGYRVEGQFGRNDAWESEASQRRQQGQFGRNDGWESEALQRQQVAYPQNEDNNNDGWEIVHKKPSRRHHKFYLEEAKGKVDYQGYIFPRRRGNTPDSEMQLLTIQFEWNGVLKSVSSTLIGVSPEFEIALYTLCFYSGGEDNYVDLGPYKVNVKCYRHGQRLGSAFPVTVD